MRLPKTNTENATKLFFFSFLFFCKTKKQITDFLLGLYLTLVWKPCANPATGIRCRPRHYCKEKVKRLLSRSTFILMKQSSIQKMLCMKHHPAEHCATWHSGRLHRCGPPGASCYGEEIQVKQTNLRLGWVLIKIMGGQLWIGRCGRPLKKK